MYQFFVKPSQIRGREVRITGSDVNHIRNVLRMKPGEELAVVNGVDGREYRCGILRLEESEVVCELRFIKEDGLELPSRVHLFQGLPKGDKMEWIIQKTVELGVHEIIPVAMQRCVVKLDGKKAETRRQRWQAVAEAAAKQSRRRIIPQVAEVTDFDGALRQASGMKVRLMPYELAVGMDKTKSLIEGLAPGQDIAVFIGPEGGFEQSEAERAAACGVEPITLGRRILRTETAGLTVLSWIMYRLEE